MQKLQLENQQLFNNPQQNKLASSIDAIAISEIWKHHPLSDWLTHWVTGVGVKRCYHILISIFRVYLWPNQTIWWGSKRLTTVDIHIQKVLPKQDKEWIKNPDSRLCLKAINVEIQPRSFLLIGAQIDSIWNQMFYMHSAERGISDGIYSHQTYSNFATQKTSRYSRYIEKWEYFKFATRCSSSRGDHYHLLDNEYDYIQLLDHIHIYMNIIISSY